MSETEARVVQQTSIHSWPRGHLASWTEGPRGTPLGLLTDTDEEAALVFHTRGLKVPGLPLGCAGVYLLKLRALLQLLTLGVYESG